MINLRQLLFYTSLFLITYFIYVYPFSILNKFLFQRNIFEVSSFFLTFFFYLIILFYFKSQNTVFILKLFVYEGMGIGFISFWIVNLGLIINNFNFLNSFELGIFCISLIITITILSLINGRLIKLKSIKIISSKVKNDTKVIFLSDMHLGTNSKNYLEKIYLKINNLKFDFLLIGGDLIDSSTFDLQSLCILQNLGKPVFFISGNHEYYIKDYKKKLKKLNKFDLQFLDNSNHKIENINIIGISDNQKLDSQKKIAENLVQDNFFNLIVVHKPTLWENFHERVDLMLSGHTHNGQIFPFNFFVKLQFKYIYGLYKKLNSKLYVSSGCGCWGPKMRLGSNNEIVKFLISNKQDSI